MSLGEYKMAHDNTVFVRNDLEALYDVGSDADMEDGEEDEETSSSRCDKPGIGSRHPRKDDPDASSSKRSRSSRDRPLDGAGPLSSPRSGGDSTPSGVEASRTGPVRDPWMPTPNEIQSRFAIPLRRVSTHCTRLVTSRTMMALRSSTLIRRRIKDVITTSDSSMSYDGTGIRRPPVEAEYLSGTQFVKAEVASLTTSTATQLVTMSAFAYRANAMSASPSAQD
ncbi:unnamed protein product [Phytophthora fragariaefolia]|uniref:Unnamed protein product n=1 Tax=Phytophthora fragariaefolia TaxID=1490495 RepID=A0A9W6YJU9_9STRA|nr:unnamed protein product [Phytophthora fragariaefolia]